MARRLALAAVLLLSLLAHHSDALAVMSVDLGSEFMKVAIVKPGVPLEIALNKESRRKTPSVVSMKNGERLFSDPALNTAVRFPDRAYKHLLDIVGKTLDNPVVQKYQERFPFYKLEADPVTGTVLFRHDEATTYSPEELLAMILQHARVIAEDFAEQSVKDVVVTVPAFFNQAERRALARAVDIAGLKLLQLMSDNTAVALQFGIFRRKEFTNVTQHYLLFDMGATSTTASVVAYQEVKQKNAVTGQVEKFPQLTIKGTGFDRQLGGLEIQLRLRDHLARAFNAQKKTATDVFTNPRSMGKLLKEAGRLKQVLSANLAHTAQVESLLDDVDFKVKVTREELEEMCKDLFDRVKAVVDSAIASSHVTMDEVSEVLLMGAGTRVPKVQEKLVEATGRSELGKSLNTDEAAAIGAVYQAAYLSKGFKVKKFAVRDNTLFPIQVEFERVKTDENGEESTKVVKRTLFGRNNPFPQKKVMTFNKHVKDFRFAVNYGDLSFMTEEELKMFGSSQLTEVSLEGVGAAFEAHAGTEPKGVKAHFRMDESGLLGVEKVEALFEKAPPAEGEEQEESTLSKLGNTISNFFGGGEKDADKEGDVKSAEPEGEEAGPEEEEQKKTDGEKPKEAEKEEKKEAEKEETKQEKENEGAKEKTKEEAEPEAEKPKEQKEDPKTEEKAEKTEEKEGEKKEEKEGDKKDDKKDKKEEKEKKPAKPTTIREDIKSSVSMLDMKDPANESLSASKQKLKDLKKRDEDKLKLEAAMNDLESHIVTWQDRLWQDAYQAVSTEEQREEISGKLSEASDWLYETDETTTIKDYENKLSELKKVTKGLKRRMREAEERPRYIDILSSMVNYSEHFLVSMKNFTGDEIGEQPFTTVEYNTLEKLITDIKAWNESVSAEQAATAAHERPKLMVEDLKAKASELDREVKYLVNKAKIFRPKKPAKEPAKDANKTEKADTNETKTNETKTEIPPAAEKEEEGVQMDLPPLPTEEEKKEKEGGRKSRKEKKEEEEKKGEEETLQLDGEVPVASGGDDDSAAADSAAADSAAADSAAADSTADSAADSTAEAEKTEDKPAEDSHKPDDEL